MTDLKKIKLKLIKTEKAEELYKKLKEIWDNEHFIIGVFSHLDNEEKKQEMIAILDSGLTDTDEIILTAMAIEQDTDVASIKEYYEIDW